MPDKHLSNHYPSSAPLRLMMGSFFCAQPLMPVAAMQLNGLACCNSMSEDVGLTVYWGLGLG